MRSVLNRAVEEAPPHLTKPTSDEAAEIMPLVLELLDQRYEWMNIRTELLRDLGPAKYLGKTWIHRLRDLVDAARRPGGAGAPRATRRAAPRGRHPAMPVPPFQRLREATRSRHPHPNPPRGGGWGLCGDAGRPIRLQHGDRPAFPTADQQCRFHPPRSLVKPHKPATPNPLPPPNRRSSSQRF